MYFGRSCQRELQKQSQAVLDETVRCGKPKIISSLPHATASSQGCDPAYHSPVFNDQGPFYHHLSCTLSGWEMEAEIIAVLGSGHGSRAVTPSVLPAFINLLVTRAHQALSPTPSPGKEVAAMWEAVLEAENPRSR